MRTAAFVTSRPVAHGAVLNDAGLREMANRYGVSVAQLCIRYSLELDALPLPKTLNPSHIRDNAAIDFTIFRLTRTRYGAQDRTDYGDANMCPGVGKKRQVEPTASEN